MRDTAVRSAEQFEPYDPGTDAPGPASNGGRRWRWLLWLAAAIVLAVFGYVLWFAYLEGIAIRGEPPLIHADASPYKEVPQDRGGLKPENRSEGVVDVFDPKRERQPDVLTPSEASPPPEPAAAPRLEAAVVAPDPSTLPPLPPVVEPPRVQQLPALPGGPLAAEPVLPEPAAGVASAETPPPSRPRPELETLTAREPPPPAAAKPVASARREPPPAARPAAPRPVQPPRPAPAPAAAQPRPAPPATTVAVAGAWRLQLAAIRSEAATNQAWSTLRQRHAVALNGTSPIVERTLTANGPLFRLQAGSFPTKDAATNACAMIKAQSGQCFVVSGPR